MMIKTKMKKQKEMVLVDNDEETQRVPVEESMGNILSYHCVPCCLSSFTSLSLQKTP